jgi:hypothetical protein
MDDPAMKHNIKHKFDDMHVDLAELKRLLSQMQAS